MQIDAVALTLVPVPQPVRSGFGIVSAELVAGCRDLSALIDRGASHRRARPA